MWKLMLLVAVLVCLNCTILTGAFTSKCGDGFLQASSRNHQSEECDDGNDTSGDGCDDKCQFERPATLLSAVSTDLEQVYLTGTASQEIVDLSFVADPDTGKLASVPTKSFKLCWADEVSLPPTASLSVNLGLKDQAGAVVAPLSVIDVATGCASLVLDEEFSLAVGGLAEVFTVFGDIASADTPQHLVLKAGDLLSADGQVVGNTPVQTLGRGAYSGLVRCTMQDVTDPVLVDQSGLPVADLVCEAFGESVTIDALQWDMTKQGQTGSINGFAVFKDGVGVSGAQVSCSAPVGIDQCLILAPTAEVLVPGVPVTYELRIDVAGSAVGATQTWTADVQGFAFTVTDGTHDGTFLMDGQAVMSN